MRAWKQFYVAEVVVAMETRKRNASAQKCSDGSFYCFLLFLLSNIVSRSSKAHDTVSRYPRGDYNSFKIQTVRWQNTSRRADKSVYGFVARILETIISDRTKQQEKKFM